MLTWVRLCLAIVSGERISAGCRGASAGTPGD